MWTWLWEINMPNGKFQLRQGGFLENICWAGATPFVQSSEVIFYIVVDAWTLPASWAERRAGTEVLDKKKADSRGNNERTSVVYSLVIENFYHNR